MMCINSQRTHTQTQSNWILKFSALDATNDFGCIRRTHRIASEWCIQWHSSTAQQIIILIFSFSFYGFVNSLEIEIKNKKTKKTLISDLLFSASSLRWRSKIGITLPSCGCCVHNATQHIKHLFNASYNRRWRAKERTRERERKKIGEAMEVVIMGQWSHLSTQ